MNNAAFIATIMDEPLHPGPRLVFADWLEERGDPRGEVLRALHDSSDWRHRSLIGSWKAGWDRADSSATIPEDLPATVAPLAATMNLRLVLPMATPALGSVKTWSGGWSAARVTEVIHRTLAVSELVALGFLPSAAALSSSSAALSASAAALYVRNAALSAIAAAGAARNAALSASDAALSARDAALSTSSDAALSVSDAALSVRNAALSARNAALSVSNSALSARNAASFAAAALFGSAQWAELAQLLVPVAA